MDELAIMHWIASQEHDLSHSLPHHCLLLSSATRNRAFISERILDRMFEDKMCLQYDSRLDQWFVPYDVFSMCLQALDVNYGPYALFAAMEKYSMYEECPLYLTSECSAEITSRWSKRHPSALSALLECLRAFDER